MGTGGFVAGSGLNAVTLTRGASGVLVFLNLLLCWAWWDTNQRGKSGQVATSTPVDTAADSGDGSTKDPQPNLSEASGATGDDCGGGNRKRVASSCNIKSLNHWLKSK